MSEAVQPIDAPIGDHPHTGNLIELYRGIFEGSVVVIADTCAYESLRGCQGWCLDTQDIEVDDAYVPHLGIIRVPMGPQWPAAYDNLVVFIPVTDVTIVESAADVSIAGGGSSDIDEDVETVLDANTEQGKES